MRQRTVLFGGSDSTGVALADTWEWNGVAWTLRSTSGPNPRFGHAVAYDSARGVTVLFGGTDDGFTFNSQTWEWNGTGWTLRSSTGPSARAAHAMAYDSARGRTVQSL